MELLMTGDMIGAEEARGLGLVNHVVPSADLLNKARDIARKIQQKAPVAVGHVISLVNAAARGEAGGFDREIALFGACFATDDKIEGTAAFMEKRKPSFQGK